MIPFLALVALLSTLLAVNANALPNGGLSARHAHLAHRVLTTPAPQRRNITRRQCKNRNGPSNNNAAASSSLVTSASTASSAVPQATQPPATTNSSSNTSGTINVQSSCGPSGATADTTATTGPNGSIDFLNCGINSGGWQPPLIQVHDVIAKSLSDAISSGNSPFMACSQYVWMFQKYGAQFGIPDIMLASFALQESSCNPNTVGGAGEQGLMQLTVDKCGGAPGGNCKDPEFNIMTGASYFSNTLNSNGGDLLTAIGQYNGWHRGMTYADATAAAHTSCCRCQNNLDYLQQFMNGWLQNIDAYSQSHPLGKYFNLNVC